MGALLAFWTIPVAFLSALTNLENLGKVVVGTATNDRAHTRTACPRHRVAYDVLLLGKVVPFLEDLVDAR